MGLACAPGVSAKLNELELQLFFFFLVLLFIKMKFATNGLSPEGILYRLYKRGSWIFGQDPFANEDQSQKEKNL